MELKVVVLPDASNRDFDELFVEMDGTRIKVGSVRRGFSQDIDVNDALKGKYCWEWVSGWLIQEYVDSKSAGMGSDV